MKTYRMKRLWACALCGAALALTAPALSAQEQEAPQQQVLSLETCRKLAVQTSKELDLARSQMEMAALDKKIAFANYLPKLSATGTYSYNSRNLDLVSDQSQAALGQLAQASQTKVENAMALLVGAIQSTPALGQLVMQSPQLQQLAGMLSQVDLGQTIGAIATEIEKALEIDNSHLIGGLVSLQQPLYMGGKIVAANKVAKMAEELSATGYDQQYQEVLASVDRAYWQIVSVAAKERLAASYAALLHAMERDVDLAVEEGVSTASDALQVKVKANEADMLLTKAQNGLALAKMLLCKQIGLDLDSPITLAHEHDEELPLPLATAPKDLEAVYADRPETRSLALAGQIFDGKAKMVRSEMLPKVALTGNYLVSNPSVYNGFQKKFGGVFSAGILVSVPIFHGMEARYKTRKAVAEADLYRIRLDEAKELIRLQVAQLHKQRLEGVKKWQMAKSNLESAKENLRMARLGFAEGLIPTNTALAAQTAWLQAQSEYIDAEIALQMNQVDLQRAEGSYPGAAL